MRCEKVVFIDSDLEKAFNQIPENDSLKKSLRKAIKDIKSNVWVGRNVKKKLIPKNLKEEYKINNLWIYNLPDAWRLIYSITPSKEIKIIAAILDWMSHKDYERLFKF